MANKNGRKGVPKRIRFEVFQRDGFKCRFCGKKAEATELQVDHVKPFAKGGTDDPDNLVTTCGDCNRGKSDKDVKVPKKPRGRGKGKPFEKGKPSGNPSGRPKLNAEQRQQRIEAQAIIDAASPEAAWTLVEMLESFDPKVRQLAADSILDRASVTGTTRIQLTGAEGGPIKHDLKLLSDKQLRALNALVAIAERQPLSAAQTRELDALVPSRKALPAG